MAWAAAGGQDCELSPSPKLHKQQRRCGDTKRKVRTPEGGGGGRGEDPRHAEPQSVGARALADVSTPGMARLRDDSSPGGPCRQRGGGCAFPECAPTPHLKAVIRLEVSSNSEFWDSSLRGERCASTWSLSVLCAGRDRLRGRGQPIHRPRVSGLSQRWLPPPLGFRISTLPPLRSSETDSERPRAGPAFPLRPPAPGSWGPCTPAFTFPTLALWLCCAARPS